MITFQEEIRNEIQEECREEGRDEGITIGREEGIAIGEERGISIGLSQGAHQKAVETAKVLKAAGVEINLIINSTGLSVEEIEKL
jgi:predicted transposase YdaD